MHRKQKRGGLVEFPAFAFRVTHVLDQRPDAQRGVRIDHGLPGKQAAAELEVATGMGYGVWHAGVTFHFPVHKARVTTT